MEQGLNNGDQIGALLQCLIDCILIVGADADRPVRLNRRYYGGFLSGMIDWFKGSLFSLSNSLSILGLCERGAFTV